MKLIIQIPCYNEADTIKVTLDALPKHLEGIDEIEYLIVDDGSSDDTVKVAEKWGVHHVVRFPQNKGLARAFMAGIDGCLQAGADIIVNTDADNQYDAKDIEALIAPILNGKAEMVVGARPIDDTEHWSWWKKRLQHIGSWAVRKASGTDIPDAPSGFRAMTADCAMRLNVINDYTYTLETIVQAGRDHIAITSVPIHTNEDLRPSRLMGGSWAYIKKSIVIILRAYMVYQPLKFFTYLSILPILAGLFVAGRFIYFFISEGGAGHVQSLIMGCTLLILGFLTFMIGLVADMIAANRRILCNTQYHVKKSGYDRHIENYIQQVGISIDTASNGIKGKVDFINDKIDANALKLCEQKQQISGLEAKLTEQFNIIQKKSDISFDNIKRFENRTYNVGLENEWAHVFHDAIIQSSWLKYRDFTPGRWAVGYPYLYVMYRVLNEMRPNTILELGLGQTTKMITQYAATDSTIKHFVSEHDDEWIAFWQQSNQMSSNTEIIKLELEKRDFLGQEIFAYKEFEENIPKLKYDFISIDAPFGPGEQKYSRVDMLNLLPSCLAESFVIMIDDCNRKGEENTVHRIELLLQESNISYVMKKYIGEKSMVLMTSENNQYLVSL